MTNLTRAALIGTKEANRQTGEQVNGALGGRWDGSVRAKPRACGGVSLFTWKPSVAQADEDGFSFLSEEQIQLEVVREELGLGLAS